MKIDKFKITNVARISAVEKPAPGTAIVAVDYQEMRDYLIREEFYKLKGNAWQNAVILRSDQLILEKNEILGHRRGGFCGLNFRWYTIREF